MCTAAPKVPKPTPVIERQAYKNPVSRASLSSDSGARQRMIAGVATSAQGVTGQASTTRKVTGGDQPLMPLLSTGATAPVIPVVDTPVVGPLAQPQTAVGSKQNVRGLASYAASKAMSRSRSVAAAY